ncbi:hypothetical protein MTO96_031914 [Rhipicephalus appendiculatus]
MGALLCAFSGDAAWTGGRVWYTGTLGTAADASLCTSSEEVADHGGDPPRPSLHHTKRNILSKWLARVASQYFVAVRRRPGRPPLLDSQLGRRLRRCLVCGYTTAFHTSMQNHQRIHTGERPHKCDYCGKAFMQKGNLVAHLRIHTGEKPFRCHLCSMAFTQKTSLVGHVRTHTGEKPFQCRFCPMVFARKMQMKRHEVTHMWSAAEAAAEAVASREGSLMNHSSSSN